MPGTVLNILRRLFYLILKKYWVVNILLISIYGLGNCSTEPAFVRSSSQWFTRFPTEAAWPQSSSSYSLLNTRGIRFLLLLLFCFWYFYLIMKLSVALGTHFKPSNDIRQCWIKIASEFFLDADHFLVPCPLCTQHQSKARSCWSSISFFKKLLWSAYWVCYCAFFQSYHLAMWLV